MCASMSVLWCAFVQDPGSLQIQLQDPATSHGSQTPDSWHRGMGMGMTHDSQVEHVAEELHAQDGLQHRPCRRGEHVRDGRRDLDGQQARDADEEPDDSLRLSISSPAANPSASSVVLTVTALPTANARKSPSRPANNLTKRAISPLITTPGVIAASESMLVQYAKSSVEPSTCRRLVLMSTACIAIMAAESTPRSMPSAGASGTSPAPTGKGRNEYVNPQVTSAQQIRVREVGRAPPGMNACSAIVNGSTNPRATWK